jgi:hypothetical protein
MVSTILIALAAIFKAGNDKALFHYSKSIFKNFNPMFFNNDISWKNKWKNGDKEQGEKFPLSSTALVMFTDFYHLSNFFHTSFFQLAIISVFFFSLPIFHENMWIMIGLNFILFKVVYGGVFTLFFSYVFERKEGI